MRFPGFVGPSYTLDSVNADCQRTVNLYPELNEVGRGKEGEQAWLRSTPGLEKVMEVGDGPIRMVHVDPQGRIFICSGDEMYKATFDGTTWSSSLIGTLATSTGIVRAASANLDDGTTVFVDGDTCYLFWAYDDSGPVEEFGNFASFGYAPVDGATHVVLADGSFIFCEGLTNAFYVSDINSLAVSPLSFASAEGDPDKLLAMAVNSRDLWIVGERSTEVWANTGNSNFPYQRVEGGFIEKGTAAAGSVAKIDGQLFWLGRDEFGQGVVYTARGLIPEKISTKAIETAIRGYGDISGAVAYCYSSGGHSFYVLNFSQMTWVYDLSTGAWHERAYTNSGTLERHRGQVHHFLPGYGLHLIGDYANNKIYVLNDEYYTDDGTEITRLRAAPHVSSNGKRLFCSLFELDMETGVGNAVDPGADPQVMLDWSDDGGHTWSNEAWTSAGGQIGGIGLYRTRVRWRRLGSFRDRVFRVKITDPVKVAILGANLEVSQGAA